MIKKKKTSHTLTPQARELLKKLSEKTGLYPSSVLELAIRRMAKSYKVTLSSDKESGS